MAFSSPSASSSSIILVNDTLITGTTTYNFTIPQAAQNIVAKIWLASGWSATGSAIVTIQTTEDGGTTWRDVGSTSIGTNVPAATVGNQNAHFIPIGVGWGSETGVANYVGSVAASTFTATAPAASVNGIVSGLPMLGTLGRIQIARSGTISTGGINVQVFAPTTDYTN